MRSELPVDALRDGSVRLAAGTRSPCWAVDALATVV